MKTCHITTVHSPFDTRIFHKECRSLAGAGCEVSLIARHDALETVQGVRIIPLPPARGRLSRMLLLPLKALRLALREKAGVYHFHDPELIHIGLVLRLLGNKVVYDVHEDLPRDILEKEWISPILRKTISFAFRAFENFSARRMSLLVCATPSIRDRFIALGCNAVDVNNYPMLAELSASPEPDGPKEKAVCYVGGVRGVRGLFEMMRACDTAGVKLILAGNFQAAGERERAENMPEWKSVEYLGHIGRNDVGRAMARSIAGLVVLHPTSAYMDSLPVKMFEYMSAGLPVIASDFPAWRGIIEGTGSGICVNPLKPNEIAGAIRRIAENPEEARNMGQRGRKTVKERFNWDTEARKLFDAYEKMLRPK